MGLADKLASPQIKELEVYQSARRIGGAGNVYLNANESPFPAYKMPTDESWQRYPDFLPDQVARDYARYAGVSSASTLTVRGADEAIDLLIRCFCQPQKDSIRINSPTYAMYEFIAKAHQVAVIDIPLNDNFSLDMDQKLANKNKSKLIFLCHPNNPTGNLLKVKDVLSLAESHKDDALIIVDEAYIEFCPDCSLVGKIENYPNLVVLRTLSKAFAMAAVRIGFVIADESVIELIAKLIAPYPIPDPCARIALNALSDEGIAFMLEQRDRIISIKAKYQEKLADLVSVKRVYPSVVNFLLTEFEDSQTIFAELKKNGIILRDQNHIPNLANHLRITIGEETEMERLISCLSQLE